jgi:signal transduction histidine kinase
MQDGRLWFSTIRGVIVIDPNHLEHRLPPPRVVVESVTVNGQQERPAAVADLPSGAKNVAFTYTAPSFVVPARMTFRYILDGFDRDWTDAGTRRESFYTNLPPGQFRFRVQACNVDGKCAETAGAVALAIAPRLYQRAWFWPSSVALAALSVWLLYRRRLRRLRAQFAIVLAERSRIARELHDTLIQGFAGITMELQALAGRLPLSHDRSNLEDIIRDAGWSLREARRSLAGLRSVQGGGPALGQTIARTARQVTAGKHVRLKLKIDTELPDVAANTAYNLQRIAQEAVSNATTHSRAATIEVTLHRTAHRLAMTIADDGSGFEAEPAGLMQAGHYGLVGMRERAEEIGATFAVDSARGEGTRVTVTVPIVRPSEPEEPRPIASDKRKTG